MRKESLNLKLNRESLRKLVETAIAFDLERNGLYDGRFGLVNIWCSPDDKPACWDAEIKRGCLTHPRAYVGALEWEWIDDENLELHIEADPFELLERRPRRPLSEADWTEILGWLRHQALGLLRLAALLPRVVGLRCPFCPFVAPAGHLYPSLFDHLRRAHPGVRLRGLNVGCAPKLWTDRDVYPLQRLEDFD